MEQAQFGGCVGVGSVRKDTKVVGELHGRQAVHLGTMGWVCVRGREGGRERERERERERGREREGGWVSTGLPGCCFSEWVSELMRNWCVWKCMRVG